MPRIESGTMHDLVNYSYRSGKVVIVMAYSKSALLDKAIEIIKAYATSANSSNLQFALKSVYEMLVQLNEQTEK